MRSGGGVQRLVSQDTQVYALSAGTEGAVAFRPLARANHYLALAPGDFWMSEHEDRVGIACGKMLSVQGFERAQL